MSPAISARAPTLAPQQGIAVEGGNGRPASSAHRRWWLPPAVAGAAVGGARLWTSRGRVEYAIWPDEPAQLAIARYLGSGVRWNMHDHSTWRPGYGTILAPVYWFTNDPATVYRTAMELNAVLGGVAAVLLYVLARRLTSMSPSSCAAAAVFASLLPSALFATDFAWSEPLAVPLLLAFLVLLLRFHDRPTLGGGIAAGAVAALAFGTHSRMLPLLVIASASAVVTTMRRRLPASAAVSVVAWCGAAFLAVSAYSSALVERLWDEPFERNSYAGMASQVVKVADMFVTAAGQAWYLLVASAGLGALGLGTIAVRAAGRGGRPVPAVRDARLVLVVVASEFAVSAAFMSDRWRPDHVVYGRYNDAFVGPLVLVGLALLLDVGRRRVAGLLTVGVAGVTAGLGLVLHSTRGDQLSGDGTIEPMVLGLQGFFGSTPTIPVLAISALAIATGSMVTLVARTRPAVGTVALPVVLSALLVVGWINTSAVLDERWNGDADVESIARLRSRQLTDGVAVEYLLPADSNSTGRMMLYQFHLPETPFVVVDHVGGPSRRRPVFAPVDDPDLRALGARLVWRDPARPIGLWIRPTG